MQKKLWILGLSLFLASCTQHGEALNPTSPKEATLLEFTSIANGHNSGFCQAEQQLKQAKLFVITNQAELDEFWNAHTAINKPRPAAPTVDFKNETLLALIDKLEPNTAYGIKITGLERKQTHIAVTAVRDVPGPNILAGDALTMPYHIIKTSRSDLKFELKLRDNIYNE